MRVKPKCINTLFQLSNLTIHFSVGLPFVVPASEGLTVVLCTLLGPKVHRVNGARPRVAQLVETAGAWAKFTIVLRPVAGQGKKNTCREKILIWLVWLISTLLLMCQQTKLCLLCLWYVMTMALFFHFTPNFCNLRQFIKCLKAGSGRSKVLACCFF